MRTVGMILFVFLLGAGGQNQGRRGVRQTVTLNVRAASGEPIDKLAIARRGGSISLLVAASASGGFAGPISGSISVGEPVNGDRIRLAQGKQAKTFPFTLWAGETTPVSCGPPAKNCFTVSTAEINDRAGEVVYNITIDPSKAYSLNDQSWAQVRITIN